MSAGFLSPMLRCFGAAAAFLCMVLQLHLTGASLSSGDSICAKHNHQFHANNSKAAGAAGGISGSNRSSGRHGGGAAAAATLAAGTARGQQQQQQQQQKQQRSPRITSDVNNPPFESYCLTIDNAAARWITTNSDGCHSSMLTF